MSAESIDREGNWGASLVSWAGLAVAGMLFATATLTPRLADLQELKNRYAECQQRLVSLDEQSEELARVCEALQSDPQFLSELAKLELSGVRKGTETIAVPLDLQLGEGNAANETGTAASTGAANHFALRWIALLAAHPRTRAALFTFAAGIGLVSLVGIRREQMNRAKSLAGNVRRGFDRLTARYRRA